MDNQETANLLNQILSTVASSQATVIINIYSSTPPKPDISSVAAATDAEAASILGIPHARKYGEVRRYIEERKRFDGAFKQLCETLSRVDLCRHLTALFGWEVESQQLGRNLNRNR